MATPQQNVTSLEHSARTAVAAAVSLLIARLFRLDEAYWAAITTIIVLQSTLAATLIISTQRIIGTALGAVIGAMAATWFHTNLLAFAATVFVIGTICTLLRLDRVAYRYAGITLAIVMLNAHSNNTWIMAAHRFFEVSLGIAVGLALTAVWPERKKIIKN